jgi:hypothetical protein
MLLIAILWRLVKGGGKIYVFVTTSPCIVFFNLIVLFSFIEESSLSKLCIQSDYEMGRTCGTYGKEGE